MDGAKKMPTDATERFAASHARAGFPLDLIDAVGLVCGPGTTPDQVRLICALGGGWPMAVNAWQASQAPYAFILAHRETGATLAFGRPITFWTHDRTLLEQSVWQAMNHPRAGVCVIDSVEPSLDDFLKLVKHSESGLPGVSLPSDGDSWAGRR
jgi:hypothetical protein